MPVQSLLNQPGSPPHWSLGILVLTEHHRAEKCSQGHRVPWGWGLLHASTGTDTRLTPLPNLANTPLDIPMGRHTSALLQPLCGHLQVLGPAQVLPEEVVPATDLLGGRKEAINAVADTHPHLTQSGCP